MHRTLFSKTGLYLFIYFVIGFGIYGLPPYHLDGRGQSVSGLLAWGIHVFLWPVWLVLPNL